MNVMQALKSQIWQWKNRTDIITVTVFFINVVQLCIGSRILFLKVEFMVNDASSNLCHFRHMCEAPFCTLFSKLNLLNVKQISDFLVSTLCLNLRSKSLPVYFNDICIENTRIHNHYTRKSNVLPKKCNSTNLGVYSTWNKVIDKWNTFPLEIKVSLNKYI